MTKTIKIATAKNHKKRTKKGVRPGTFYGRIILLLIVVLNNGCSILKPKVELSETIPEVDFQREARLLTAFFGLDNALTKRARLLYKNAYQQDGMPVVFSLEVRPETLQGSDFEVTTKDGQTHIVEYATLLPANEAFELRTALLIGEYGNDPENPPVSVKIIGDIMSRTGRNFKGQVKAVIPLEQGPVLSYAEHFTFSDDYPYVEKGRGCDCPKDKTTTVVKTVWSGGVRAINGEELGVNELKDFKVTLVRGTDTLHITPFQLADLKDNDNNIDLCIREMGIPIRVAVNANVAIDPRNDANPATAMDILGRWE